MMSLFCFSRAISDRSRCRVESVLDARLKTFRNSGIVRSPNIAATRYLPVSTFSRQPSAASPSSARET